jgi:hypothetical protein
MCSGRLLYSVKDSHPSGGLIMAYSVANGRVFCTSLAARRDHDLIEFRVAIRTSIQEAQLYCEESTGRDEVRRVFAVDPNLMQGSGEELYRGHFWASSWNTACSLDKKLSAGTYLSHPTQRDPALNFKFSIRFRFNL